MQVIQNQLGQIGIKLNLTELDIGTMVAQLPNGDNNLNFTDVGWPEADILYILTSFGWGVGRYQPKDYMDLLKQAREIADQGKRKEFYTQAQKLFLEDLPWVPLWSPVAATRALGSQELRGRRLRRVHLGGCLYRELGRRSLPERAAWGDAARLGPEASVAAAGAVRARS